MEWSARRRSGTSDKRRARKGRRRCSLSRKSRGSCLEAAGGEAPGCSIYNWRVQKIERFRVCSPLGQGCPILLRVDCAPGRDGRTKVLFSLPISLIFFEFSELVALPRLGQQQITSRRENSRPVHSFRKVRPAPSTAYDNARRLLHGVETLSIIFL